MADLTTVQPLPQLSCELCRSRKIKCDKLQPCTACASAGAPCVPVYRLRLPRGRHVHAGEQQKRQHAPGTPKTVVDNDLRRRIRRLEALISGLADIVGSSPEEAEDDAAQTPAEAAAILSHSGGGGGGVHVLGLAASPRPSMTTGSSPSENSSHYALLLHDRPLVAQLCQVYLDQVDPIVKILHRHCLAQHLVDNKPYLGYPPGHTSIAALDAAVLYAAVASMTDSQCAHRLGGRGCGRDRALLLGDTRRACENALECADLLTTRDLAVLQAFVLYLSGRQVEEQSRAVWTLLAVAVRVAKGMSLHWEADRNPRNPSSSPNPSSFFVQQMRRHLWLTICLMDVQAGFAMASEPLIGVAEAQASFRLPRHIDDADYGPQTLVEHAPAERMGLTDCTYALVKYQLQLFGRQTGVTGSGGAGADDDDGGGGSSCSQTPTLPTPSTKTTKSTKTRATPTQEELADAFTRDTMARVFACDPEQSPLAWLVFHSARCFVAGAQVAVLRRPKGQETKTPRQSEGRPELVRACAQVLEKTVLMHTDPRGEGFRWAMTVRWHGLAIALAECYLCAASPARGAMVELLQEVWPTMEAAYGHHEAIIARYRGGRLRGPLGKLMERTRQTVAALGIPVGPTMLENNVSQPPSNPRTTESDTEADRRADTAQVESTWDAWSACWDDLFATAALDDDNTAAFDTQFYDSYLNG
ncbi:hypothetical protein SCUCBS95973_009476 [Sporothrix curviconia]|uniref:Zn(2)-C6 fungal-type domain-containing protein n=1 Tax=Sporothrix curviconia TaxID=1260050 RepID=A0ABP0CWX0_9PEZI